jgi:HK97 family phage major capsid protein
LLFTGEMKRKFLNLPFKIKDLGEGELQAVVASDKLDRHGEILDIQGLDYSDFKKNPVVLWAHDYSQPPIGKAVTLRKVGGQLVAKIKFAIAESPFAKQIHDLYMGGFLNAFSIGFIPEQMEDNRYTKSSMIEFSAVPIPANPDALALAKSKGFDVDRIFAESKAIEDSKWKGGENKMKLTKEQIKSILLGNPDYQFKAEEADQETVDEVKSELEAEKTAKEEAEKKAKAIEAAGLEAVTKHFDEKLASLKKELDTPVVKAVNNVNGHTVTSATEEISKEEKLKAWVKGMAAHDMSEYKQIMQKAGMTTGNTSEIVPPAEFVAEVLRLEEEVGVARRYANVRRTDKEAIQGILGGDDVAIFETAEAGVKRSTKINYDTWNLTFRKWAAIAPVTDELLESSAIDVWNDLTQRFARAFALKEDELVFTDATSGIVNLSGVNEVLTSGTSIEDITFDDLNKMVFSVPTQSLRNGRFFLNRTLLGAVQRIKDQQDRYIWAPGQDGAATGTIWGYPYALVDVLPGLADDADDTVFAIFGDLRNTMLVERTGMQAKIFDTGLVADPDDSSDPYDQLNLLTQDMQALRVVKRMNAKTVFPRAYSVLRTTLAS